VTNWTTDELATLDDADELKVAGRRSDGSYRKPVIVWMVRLGDDVFTRSVNGPDAAWYRGVRAEHEGRVSVDGLDKDVAFVDVDAADPINASLDAAYRSKYRRYNAPVKSITSDVARTATLKIVPQQ
jgi:hypothetical protein